MDNFSAETPEIHNGNGDRKRIPDLEENPMRVTPAELQEQIEILVEEIGRIKNTLETVSRGPTALEYGPEVQDELNRKEELLRRLLEKQREMFKERGN